jgi:hypothetical protein
MPSRSLLKFILVSATICSVPAFAGSLRCDAILTLPQVEELVKELKESPQVSVTHHVRGLTHGLEPRDMKVLASISEAHGARVGIRRVEVSDGQVAMDLSITGQPGAMVLALKDLEPLFESGLFWKRKPTLSLLPFEEISAQLEDRKFAEVATGLVLVEATPFFKTRIEFVIADQALAVVDFISAQQYLAAIQSGSTSGKAGTLIRTPSAQYYLLTTETFETARFLTKQQMVEMSAEKKSVSAEPISKASAPAKRRVVRRFSISEFTVQRKLNYLLEPQETKLSPHNPLAVITWYDKPGWAAMDGEWLRTNALSTVLEEVQKSTGSVLSKTAQDKLAKLQQDYTRVDLVNHTTLANPTGTKLLNDLLKDQSPMVTVHKGQKSLAWNQQQRIVIIPLSTITLEAPKPEPRLAPASSALTQESPEPSGLDLAFAAALNPKKAALVRLTGIAADRDVQIKISEQARARVFIKDQDHFMHFLIKYFSSGVPRSDSYQLIYLQMSNRETLRVHFDFDLLKGLVTVTKIDQLEEAEETQHWFEFSKFHNIHSITHLFPASQKFLVGSKYPKAVSISGAVRAKLEYKHDINHEQLMAVLAAARSSVKTNRGVYRADVRHEGRTISLYFGLDESGNCKLITAY